MKKNKNKINKSPIKIIMIIIGIILIGGTFIKVYFDFIRPKSGESKELDRLGLYGYTLNNTDTNLYKENYKALSKVVGENIIDYEKYAEYLTKLFIIDTFTLTNKKASTDIGGLEFVYPDMVENFKLNAGDTLYKYVETNLDGKREQKLPEVSAVTINSIKQTKFTYNKKEYEAYYVNASWEYVTDLGYVKTKDFMLIKDLLKLYVVEG